MNYPFEIVSSDAETATVAIQCPFCGGTSLLKVSIAGLRARQEGALIQVAFPDMPAADRELFVSGICAKCFPTPPDEDDADDFEDEDDEDDCDCDGCDCDDCDCPDPARELDADEVDGDRIDDDPSNWY